MTRHIVNDTTPQHLIPTIRTGVPIPSSGKGRKAKPLNPSLLKMQHGESFIVSGEAEVKEMRADLQRVVKSHPECKFVTRTLTGQLNTDTLEQYPSPTMGVWCVVACYREDAPAEDHYL